jgi:pimeloyl-ACP methyl ester carboxylesterase
VDNVQSWLTRPFARERDIVLVDQRGTGQSDPLCPHAAKEVVRLMAQDLSPADDVAGNVAIARRCLEGLRQRGLNPVEYSSAATATDLKELREALGYEKWNLLGISYGARLALTVMRDHPEGIRSVVLDSPFPPSEDFYLTLRQSSRAALERLTADCAAAPSCSTVDIEAGLAAFEAELASRPLPLDMDDPEIAPGGTFFLNAQDLRFLVTELLAFGSTRVVLPAFVHAWRMGNTDSLVALFKVMAHAFDGHDLGKYYAVQCHEEMPFSALGRLDATRLVAFHDAAHAVCADWGLPSAGVRENAPVGSAIPALLVAGELDPRAPPRFARRALENLPHGVLVEVPGAGHNTLDQPCVGDVVAAFLNDPARTPGTSCLVDRPEGRPLGTVRVTSGPLGLLRALQQGNLPLLSWASGALIVMLGALLVWPLRSLWRWRSLGAGVQPCRARGWRLRAVAHGLMVLAGLLAWFHAIALIVATLRLLDSEYALAVLVGLPGNREVLFVLPKLVAATALGSLALFAVSWRQAAWHRLDRIHYVVTMTATLSFVVFLVQQELF